MTTHNKHDIRNFIDTMTGYFVSGETAPREMKTGMELEHFVVKPGNCFAEDLISDGNTQSVFYCGDKGVEAILDNISGKFDTIMKSGNSTIGLAGPDYSITLEPSAQLEISISPVKELFRASLIYSTFKRTIGPTLDRFGYKLANYGYNPRTRACESPLIPKKRYEFMDRFFADSGSMGINMMRSTASCQISVDYENEKDFVRKYRAAYVISPALKYICDNTPVFEGKENMQPLKRTEIWHNVDESRCRMPEGLFQDDFSYEAYAKYLWNTPAIYVPALTKVQGDKEQHNNRIDCETSIDMDSLMSGEHGGSQPGSDAGFNKEQSCDRHRDVTPAVNSLNETKVDRSGDIYVGNVTVGELWEQGVLGENDLEFIMSMVFPDVRLKSFIEIRYADSIPFNEALGYMALLKGLMYDDSVLDWILSFDIGEQDIYAAEQDITQNSTAAVYMGYTVDKLINRLFDMAHEGLAPHEREFLLPLKTRRFKNESIIRM